MHQKRCLQLEYGPTDTPEPDFLALCGTVAVNKPRLDLASALARLIQSTQVASRPKRGVLGGTRGRSQRFPGLPLSPFGTLRYYLVAIVWRSLLCGCSYIVKNSFFAFPSVAQLSPLFEAYRTRLGSHQHLLGCPYLVDRVPDAISEVRPKRWRTAYYGRCGHRQ